MFSTDGTLISASAAPYCRIPSRCTSKWEIGLWCIWVEDRVHPDGGSVRPHQPEAGCHHPALASSWYQDFVRCLGGLWPTAFDAQWHVHAWCCGASRPLHPFRCLHIKCGDCVGNIKAINKVPVWHVNGSLSNLPKPIHLGEWDNTTRKTDYFKYNSSEASESTISFDPPDSSTYTHTKRRKKKCQL